MVKVFWQVCFCFVGKGAKFLEFGGQSEAADFEEFLKSLPRLIRLPFRFRRINWLGSEIENAKPCGEKRRRGNARTPEKSFFVSRVSSRARRNPSAQVVGI